MPLVIELLGLKNVVKLVEREVLTMHQVENLFVEAKEVDKRKGLKAELNRMGFKEYKALMEEPPAPVRMAPGCRKKGKVCYE